MTQPAAPRKSPNHNRAPTGYPFAIVRTESGYSAAALQFPALATAATREELLELLREQGALYLFEHQLEGTHPAAPLPPGALDLSDYHQEGLEPEVIYLEPLPFSEISLAIERALRDEGLSHAELARRMGSPRSVVSRLTDPLYFGHSSRTLRNVAKALGRELRVELVKVHD